MRVPGKSKAGPHLERRGRYWKGTFTAMASPCEVLCRGSQTEAAAAMRLSVAEARRIEDKFSRYRDDNIVAAINNSRGRPVRVDSETGRLLGFADQCYELSGGAFDITSGVLRKAWVFDGSDTLPDADRVKDLLPLVGWPKAEWSPPFFTLPEGMQVDFGGLGKEYAADRIAEMLAKTSNASYLVNLGGDIRATGRKPSNPWSVGVEQSDREGQAVHAVRISAGALATSGDTRKFVENQGVRYGHILDPSTGWPVVEGPHSVTVRANTCIEAGVMATLAMLQGSQAEAFLEAQGVRFWCQR
jgi:thiamine biosynthesis lipoprotein